MSHRTTLEHAEKNDKKSTNFLIKIAAEPDTNAVDYVKRIITISVVILLACHEHGSKNQENKTNNRLLSFLSRENYTKKRRTGRTREGREFDRPRVNASFNKNKKAQMQEECKQFSRF